MWWKWVVWWKVRKESGNGVGSEYGGSWEGVVRWRYGMSVGEWKCEGGMVEEVVWREWWRKWWRRSVAF